MNVTHIERYAEALAELRKAEEALDQAQAMFKDFGLHNYSPRHGKSVSSLVSYAAELIRDFETYDCDECGQPLATHEKCLAGTCHLTPEEETARDEARYHSALEMRYRHSI